MSSNYLIILNPVAGNGKGKKNWSKIKNILKSNNVSYDLKITRKIKHAKLIINYYLRKWKKQNNFPKCIIIIGGDGTVNEVLNSIFLDKTTPKIPIGILPFGNNNNFAKANRINPNEWKKALLKIINNNPKNINIVLFNEKIKQEHGVFINQLGIGLNTNIIMNRNRLHKFMQLVSLIPILYNIDSFNTNIKIDSKKYTFKKAITCLVTNEIIKNDDNNPLNLIVIEKKNIFKLICTILAILMKKHFKLKSIHNFYGKNINVSISSLEYGQIDGNNFGSRFYDIEYKITKYPFII